MEWCLFYDQFWHKRFEPLFFYLAQIAMETLRPHLKPGAQVKLEDFMFKFEPPKPVDQKLALAWAKAQWLGVLGVADPKNPKVTVRRAPIVIKDK